MTDWQASLMFAVLFGIWADVTERVYFRVAATLVSAGFAVNALLEMLG